MISLVAFLGNFGREYEATRHNVAWLFCDSLAFASRLHWQKKFKGLYCALNFGEFAEICAASGILAKSDGSPVAIPAAASEKLFFLKPETYMNESGESVAALVNFYKLKAENVLVVHDELELALGTISLKWSGGLGGHNGLRSTKAHLNTADFWRLRFGIGRPEGADVAGYVLSPFTSDERITLSQTFPKAQELFAKTLLSSEPQVLLKEWGKKKVVG